MYDNLWAFGTTTSSAVVKNESWTVVINKTLGSVPAPARLAPLIAAGILTGRSYVSLLVIWPLHLESVMTWVTLVPTPCNDSLHSARLYILSHAFLHSLMIASLETFGGMIPHSRESSPWPLITRQLHSRFLLSSVCLLLECSLNPFDRSFRLSIREMRSVSMYPSPSITCPSLSDCPWNSPIRKSLANLLRDQRAPSSVDDWDSAGVNTLLGEKMGFILYKGVWMLLSWLCSLNKSCFILPKQAGGIIAWRIVWISIVGSTSVPSSSSLSITGTTSDGWGSLEIMKSKGINKASVGNWGARTDNVCDSVRLADAIIWSSLLCSFVMCLMEYVLRATASRCASKYLAKTGLGRPRKRKPPRTFSMDNSSYG